MAGITGQVVGIVCWGATILYMPPPVCTGSCSGSMFYPLVGGFLLMIVLVLVFPGRIPVRDTGPAR